MRVTENADPKPTNSGEAEAQCVRITSLKELARDYVIVGIKGKLLRVRRKSDGAELWPRVAIDE